MAIQVAGTTVIDNSRNVVSANIFGATGVPVANAIGTLSVATGGTGQTTYTNGQILIGNTSGGTLAKGTIAAGTGISVTNGAGTITIASTAGTPSTVTATTSATDITLTSASNAIQAVNLTALGKHVTLPDATTLTLGGPKFVIQNTGNAYPIGIRDNAGNLICAVDVGNTVQLFINDISTTYGKWSFTGEADPLLVVHDSQVSTWGSRTVEMQVDFDGRYSLHAHGGNVFCYDGTARTIGSYVDVGYTVYGMWRLSATTALVGYVKSDVAWTASYPIGWKVATISGTTVSLGVEATLTGASYLIHNGTTCPPQVAQLTDTSFIFVGYNYTGSTWQALGVTVSGTTVTLGTAVSLTNSATNNPGSDNNSGCAIWKNTSSRAFVFYKIVTTASTPGAGATNPFSAQILSLSGTTITQNTVVTVGTGATQIWKHGVTWMPPIQKINANYYVAMTTDNQDRSFQYVYPFTVSGTTVTFGTPHNTGFNETSQASVDAYTVNNSSRYANGVIPVNSNAYAAQAFYGYYNYRSYLYLGYLSSTTNTSYSYTLTGPMPNYHEAGYPTASGPSGVGSWLHQGIYLDSRNAGTNSEGYQVNYYIPWAYAIQRQPNSYYANVNNVSTMRQDSVNIQPLNFIGTTTTPQFRPGSAVSIEDDGTRMGPAYASHQDYGPSAAIITNKCTLLHLGMWSQRVHMFSQNARYLGNCRMPRMWISTTAQGSLHNRPCIGNRISFSHYDPIEAKYYFTIVEAANGAGQLI